jgi:hypothetical protein
VKRVIHLPNASKARASAAGLSSKHSNAGHSARASARDIPRRTPNVAALSDGSITSNRCRDNATTTTGLDLNSGQRRNRRAIGHWGKEMHMILVDDKFSGGVTAVLQDE